MLARLTRLLSALALGGLVTACAGNPYEKFYTPMSERQLSRVEHFTGQPRFVAGDRDPRADMRRMYEDGYGLIGTAAFTGRDFDDGLAVDQAKKVGAAIVAVRQEYRNTETGVRTYQVPTTSRGEHSGTINTTDGPVYYSGSTTVRGTTTEVVPYSVDKYSYSAMFFSKLRRSGLGFLYSDMTAEEKRTAETNRGVVVTAVRKESPAYLANIVPGDILVSVDFYEVSDRESASRAIQAGFGRNVTYVLIRNGRQVATKVFVPWDTW
jgi:hypothetical protein